MRISALVCFTDRSTTASLQARLSGLETAVTDRDGPSAVVPSGATPPPGLWQRATDRWLMTRVDLEVFGITTSHMTAARMGTIKLAVNFDPRTSPDNLSRVRVAKLYALMAREVMVEPTAAQAG